MTGTLNHDLWSHFSHQEQQVVRLLVAGKAKKEIGRALNISPETVKVHLHHAFKKANVHGAVQLVSRLYHIDPPEITATPYIVHAPRGTMRRAA